MTASRIVPPHLHRHRLRGCRPMMLVLGLFGLALFGSAQAALFSSTRLPGAPAGTRAYVLASLANLRAQPQAGAAVLTRLTTNTQVKVLANNSDWCDVEVLKDNALPASADDGGTNRDARQGFMACNLLQTQPLTLAAVDAELVRELDARKMLDWHARGFWIAPSITRWIGVGMALEAVHLDDETRSRELNEEKPRRFKVPEFDAMKQRLAAGIAVKPGTLPPSPGLASNAPGMSQYPYLQAAQKRVPMAAIKPSFFKAGETPVIVPEEKFGLGNSPRMAALIDMLSASNDAPIKAVVSGSASFASNHGGSQWAGNNGWRIIPVAGAMGVIIGVWDTGGMRVTFDQDARLHGVSARGEPTARNVKAFDLGFGYDSGCSYSPTSVVMKSVPVAGYAPPSSALVSWAGKPMPGGPSARAQIKSRQVNGASEYDQLVAHEIDLDRDGVADFLVWQGRYPPQVSAEGIWTAVFANVGGQWRLLAYNEDADCT